MNTRSITINLPEVGAMPHEYVAALSQAISEHAVCGDCASAAAIGGLLSLVGLGASYAAPVRQWEFQVGNR